jgi:hypothetical protein
MEIVVHHVVTQTAFSTKALRYAKAPAPRSIALTVHDDNNYLPDPSRYWIKAGGNVT